MRLNKFLLTAALGVALLGLLSGCSSSSSGSSDTADVSLEVTPRSLRVGALSFVEFRFSNVEFDDLEEEGLVVKIVLPEELAFVAGSATFVRSDGAIALPPIFAGAFGDDGLTLLVFSLFPEQLDEATAGAIQFNVEGVDNAPFVEIAADLDPRALMSIDPEAAGFDTEVEVGLEVLEEDD